MQLLFHFHFRLNSVRRPENFDDSWFFAHNQLFLATFRTNLLFPLFQSTKFYLSPQSLAWFFRAFPLRPHLLDCQIDGKLKAILCYWNKQSVDQQWELNSGKLWQTMFSLSEKMSCCEKKISIFECQNQFSKPATASQLTFPHTIEKKMTTITFENSFILHRIVGGKTFNPSNTLKN